MVENKDWDQDEHKPMCRRGPRRLYQSVRLRGAQQRHFWVEILGHCLFLPPSLSPSLSLSLPPSLSVLLTKECGMGKSLLAGMAPSALPSPPPRVLTTHSLALCVRTQYVVCTHAHYTW